jgi:arsenate reductase-like glutaredoxin family protein
VNLSPGLSEKELDALIGTRDHKLFLNHKNEMFRERDMKNKPPSRAEAIRLMARNPNLVRRPLIIDGKRIVFGYDETAIKELLK